jgi:hypothetical protein
VTTALVMFVFMGAFVLVGVLNSPTYRRRKERRAIEGRETTPIAALREGGPAKIRGVVAAREPLLTSPIGGHRCIGYEVGIAESHDTWAYPILTREAWSSFLVTDGTGTVVVQGQLKVLVAASDRGLDLPPEGWELLKQEYVRLNDLWGPRQFQFRETLLKVGDRVRVVGRPSLHVGAAAGASPPAPSRAFVMTGSWDEPILVDDDELVAALPPKADALAPLEGKAPRVHGPSRREIERVETTAIEALEDGELARVQGVAAAREPLLTSPISGSPCIGYRVLIERKGHGSHPVVRREAWPPFMVEDRTGTAAVEGPFSILLDPDDAGWAPLPPTVYALLEEAHVPATDRLGRDQEFQFKETLLKVGDRVSVLGRPTLEIHPAGRTSPREPPRLHVLRGSEQEPISLIDVEEPIG